MFFNRGFKVAREGLALVYEHLRVSLGVYYILVRMDG